MDCAHQAPLSMGFSRKEYWSGLPCPPPGDLPDPGTEPRSPALQADSLLSEPAGKPIQNLTFTSMLCKRAINRNLRGRCESFSTEIWISLD